MVNIMVHSKDLRGKYFCSLYFQVKSVSDLLATSLTALIFLRDVNRTQKSAKYIIKRRPALTGPADCRAAWAQRELGCVG